MIQVIDIPLNFKGVDVRRSFDRYGTITKLSIVTRGLYQQAYITFTDNAAVAHFTDKAWSTFIIRTLLESYP